MRPLITFIITAYREPVKLEKLLEYLVANAKSDSLEVIVSVDEPNSELEEITKRYSDKATFLVSKSRRGKVQALNEALSLSRGEIVVFLDNDVEITDQFFIDKLYSFMSNHDVVEIKKISRNDSLIGKLIYYDYLTFGVASYIFARRVKLCAGLNGAAFAFRTRIIRELGGFKNIILEDMDIGFRSFFIGVPYGYFYQSAVLVEPPSGLRQWVNQRLRWSQGAWLWIEEYFPLLVRSGSRHLPESLLAIVVMFPWSLILPVIFLSFFPLISGPLLTLWYLGFSVFAFLLPFVYLLQTSMALLPPQAFFTVFYYFVYVLFVSLLARRIGYKVNILWLTVYFFFYAPIWFSIMIAGFTRTFLLGRKDVKGWKV
ncbi:MAG: glycosyltransferase family 2 protein [Infirmifilum sp.]